MKLFYVDKKATPEAMAKDTVATYKIEVNAATIPSMRQKYISFDVETTGLDPNVDRIIEVGAVLFENGEIVNSYSSLINAGVSIPASASAVNHITDEMIQSAPSEETVYENLVCFLGDALNEQTVICAHNASFDMTFLSKALERLGYNAKIRYADTLTLSKKLISDLINYKQDTVAQYFGLTNEQAHRAASDAEICGKIFWRLLNANNIEQTHTQQFNKTKSHRHFQKISASDIVCQKEILNSNHPFYGKKIVFTGNLLSMSRKDAMQEVVNLGGIITTAVSSKTNFLIVGQQDKAIVGSDGKSNKEEKAESLKMNGHNIEILSEDDFLLLINTPVDFESEDEAYLYMLKKLGLTPQTSKFPKQLYFRDRQGNYIECKVNKIVFEYPKVVEIEFEGTTLNIALDYLKEMQPAMKEVAIDIDSNEILKEITELIDPRLLTAAHLEIKKSETYEGIIIKLEPNSFRIECPTQEFLLARIKTDAKKIPPYISFSERFKTMLENYHLPYEKKKSDTYLRIDLNYFQNQMKTNKEITNLFTHIIVNSISYSPFDCCHKYLECSNEKTCVHPDFLYASCACGYKKHLDSGRIFYGPNRNI